MDGPRDHHTKWTQTYDIYFFVESKNNNNNNTNELIYKTETDSQT